MSKLDDELYDITRDFLHESVSASDIARRRRDHDIALDASTHLSRIIESRLPEHICLLANQLKKELEKHYGWGR